MKIPSYDDLTPGISDVHPRDTFDQVTRLVPREEPVVSTGNPAPAFAKASAFVQVTADKPPSTEHRARGTGRRQGYGGQAESRRPSPEPGAPSPYPSAVLGVPLSLANDESRPAGLFGCLRARRIAAAGALTALARDFSPRIERDDDACVVLDVSGLGRLLGDPRGIAEALQRTAADRGLEIRLAVAPTQTAVRLLTLCADVSVVDEDVALAVAPLPLDALQELVAKPSRLFDALKRWGIRSVGELAALPSGELASRFGDHGLAIQRLARGLDPRPLVPDPGVPRFIQSMELEWPIAELEPLSFVLARLLEPLAFALERADKGGAAIRLDLRLVNKTVHSRVLQLPAPMRDPRVLRTLLTLDLDSHPPMTGIDVVTIEIDPAPARIVQFSLLERAIPPPETVATLTARLDALVGEDRCGSPVLLDSYRPDAFEMQRFNPEEGRRQTGIPEPANGGTLILRRFRPPVAARVAIERGHPAHVAVGRKGMPGGRVEQYAGPWRTSGAWWDAGSQWNHDEWEVTLSDGSICRVYRDRATERWFLEAVVD